MEKRAYEKAAKKSVSMPQMMLDKAQDRMRLYNLTQFSDYIQLLVRKDLENKGAQLGLSI